MRPRAQRSLRSTFAPSVADIQAGRRCEPGHPGVELSVLRGERRNAYEPGGLTGGGRGRDNAHHLWLARALRPWRDESVLAVQIERADYGDMARRLGLTQARVSQI